MLDPSLFIHGVPGLGEALPADVYGELTGVELEEVITSIKERRLLGAFHSGQWYAEAPSFGEERLRQIWTRRKRESQTGSQDKQRAHNSGHSDSAHAPTNEVKSELDYARTLGLRGRVTKEDVKKRWRELTAQYHPDKVAHLGPKLREVAEKEMKEINQAYDCLRAKYGL